MEIKVTAQTFLKSSDAQSTSLPTQEKMLLNAGTSIPTETIESVGTHWRITNYIYKGHTNVDESQLKAEEKKQDNNNFSHSKSPKSNQTGISHQGLNLIKEFEGFRNNAYQDSAGVWTIGYGHTLTARPGMRISRSEGERLLRQDLVRFEKGVRDRVHVPLTQNQFDALVSFAFNVGVGAFSKSTLLRLLNQGDYNGAKNEFRRWVHAGGRRLQGLVRRRDREAQLFTA